MRLSCFLLCLAFTVTGQSPDSFVSDMMAFDSNHDGRLSRSEISDARLLRLFDRADANHDGFVTQDELRALSLKESAEFVPDRGWPGGPGGRDPGGPGGSGMMRIGQIIPEPIQRGLDLTDEQKAKIAALQSQVDSQLKLILTDKQRERMAQFDPRGPGGPGGPGRNGFRPGPGSPGPRFP